MFFLYVQDAAIVLRWGESGENHRIQSWLLTFTRWVGLHPIDTRSRVVGNQDDDGDDDDNDGHNDDDDHDLVMVDGW